jgi:hypothetical protein
MLPDPAAPPPLLPWRKRLLVFAALAVLALLAIRVIDRHALRTQQRYVQAHDHRGP